MDQSTTVLDIDFGMSQLSGNKKLLFTLLGKFTDEYRSLDADIQAHVSKLHRLEEQRALFCQLNSY